MHPIERFEEALRLVESGMNDCQIARLMGISRGTIRDWRHKAGTGWKPGQAAGAIRSPCSVCRGGQPNEQVYAYLLGLYLGDGCLALHHRGVYRLRISLDQAYPNIIQEGLSAIDAIKTQGKKAGVVFAEGCVEIYSYWKHWICHFPQHGPGPKHLREIRLERWQSEIAERWPRPLIRGFIHSDGSRYTNRVGAGYEYPSYDFTNNSADIRKIFTDACDLLGIHWRRGNWKHTTISRRPDVAILDTFVGPKT